ncbi:P-loop containing nucleoside triphosphate hydrolase protein [Phlegmacium glaucopus]|nr:P-loop containing nucleoside triphosphate hydrolase protein [Phlegmacium glaucopus]
MIKWGINDVGSNYEVVAVIGSQSSGKSTLLNSLFETNFVVMDPSSRGRTTNGIWLSRDKGHNVIIMDVEGSDGASRGDDQRFERKTALFALACSRLLIINIWENQVGLYNGANMGLLKIVFEEHLSLYGKLDRQVYHWPRILIVIQAHSSGTSLASLARTVTLALNKIWDSIEKPEQMRDRSLQDHFHIEFESITHMLLAPQQYKSQVESLRKRFVEKESTNYLLKDAFPNSVAADGLELYMKTIWETIRINENLNLASQHELLAQAMCNKIRTSLLDEYRPRIIAQLDILNQGMVVEGLGSLMESWKSEILARYDERARRYVQSVFAETRSELVDSYNAEVSRLITGQLRNLRLSLLATFDVVLRDAVFKEEPEFGAITSNAKRRCEDDFTTAVRNIAVSDAICDWEHDFQDLQSSLSQRIEACKKERMGSSPILTSKTERVGSRKSITTTATQYRDGRLIVETMSDCDEHFQGLRGRILIVVNDTHGNPIGVTNELRCTTRGSIWDFNTPSSGKDIFSLKFPREIGMRAVGLDIHQTDEKSLGGLLQNILQVSGVVVAA